jgi:flagellar assembly factor FliW
MRLNGTRFGTIDFEPDDMVTFEDGLIGLPTLKHFIILNTREDSPFRWLQSVEDTSMAFLIAEPTHFVTDYSPTVSDRDQSYLNLETETPCLAYVTVSIPAGKPEDMTINLAAPLIINARSRAGKQIILDDEAYTIKHRVLQAGRTVAESVAA